MTKFYSKSITSPHLKRKKKINPTVKNYNSTVIFSKKHIKHTYPRKAVPGLNATKTPR